MEIFDQIFYWILFLTVLNIPIAIMASVIEVLFGEKSNGPIQERLINLPKIFIKWFLWPRELYRMILKLKKQP